MSVSRIAPTIKQKIQIPYNYSAGPPMTVFLRGLREKTIYASLCAACGRRSVPPLSFCGRCWLPIENYVVVDQKGTLESFVESPAIPTELPGLDLPPIYGLIRLQDCSTSLVHLIQPARGFTPQAGASVRPAWREERTGSILDILHFQVE
jgi:uncharacterized OB-fold protein